MDVHAGQGAIGIETNFSRCPYVYLSPAQIQHGRCAGADLVGQRRHGQIDAFSPVALARRFNG